jgi:ATP-dependent Clp protease ATP-binding subunit ClpA
VFEIFSPAAKQAIMRAQDEAIALGDDFVGTEHLLLGMTGIPDSVAGQLLAESGLTADLARSAAGGTRSPAGTGAAIAPEDALAAIGIDVAEIRRRADETFGPGAFVYPRPVYDEAAKAAIELSVAQARELGHEFVGTGHLLLGLLGAGESAALRILGSVGLDASGRPLVLTRTAGRPE